MAAGKDQIEEHAWVLRRPLQIESLRQGLQQSDDNDRLLLQMQRHRENLDAVVLALSSRNLAPDRREHLIKMMRRYQSELEGCFKELGLPVPGKQAAPLWHFNQLDPLVRSHLGAILGVPEEPAFFEVLDIKAKEYLAQQAAFETLTESLGFRVKQRVSRKARKSILVLTLSGSLIQLSEPISRKGARRYLYQNIYGNAHPPQGILFLDRDIVVGHRLRSVELTTSPVRLVRVLGRKMSWKAQYKTFRNISRTLGSMVSRIDGPLGGKVAAADRLRRVNHRAAERVFQEEYGEALQRYEALVERYATEDQATAHQAEAELLTVCHYLQMGARELGFESVPLEEVREFETEGGAVYRVHHSNPLIIKRFPKGAGPEVELVDVSVGRQAVTALTPLTIISRGGDVIEVTTPVVRVNRRASSG